MKQIMKHYSEDACYSSSLSNFSENICKCFWNPPLPWVRSRVWVRVTLRSGIASGKGWVGTWPVNRLDPSIGLGNSAYDLVPFLLIWCQGCGAFSQRRTYTTQSVFVHSPWLWFHAWTRDASNSDGEFSSYSISMFPSLMKMK